MKEKFFSIEGRFISIIGEGKSHTFGDVYIIEELIHPQGYALSVVDKKQMETISDTWIEIGKPEWDRVLKKRLQEPKKENV
jgi:hypothetical protein